MNINSFIKKINKKITFCPGPGSISKYNILGQINAFGRNDPGYLKREKYVISKLKTISGQENIVTFQGSGTLAIEIMMLNFLYGKIIIISTGYYSKRIIYMLKRLAKLYHVANSIDVINWKKIYKNPKKKYDWVIACPTETSKGLLIPIEDLKNFSNKVNAKLMLDATGSIGLEKNHKLASVLSFSSCKGTFGFTGGAFIAYKKNAKIVKRDLSFYHDLNTHIKKKITGPYNSILSLYLVMKNFNQLKSSVIINKDMILKKMKNYLIYSAKHQPKLCTYINKKLKAKKDLILYQPRIKNKGTIISHLGETYLGSNANGRILKKLSFI